MVKPAPKEMILSAWSKVRKTAADDPRRVVHAFKVGLALTVVSAIYYADPLYQGFDASAVWAVVTVVFVMEFSVGGTLYKGLNRSLATLAAGALGVGVHRVATRLGEKAEPFVLACCVFLFGVAASFARFIPEVKSRFDYGLIIAILTFSMVSVSSYRVDDVLKFAHQRLSTVALGAAACVAISLLFFPVWSGKDLHQLVASHLAKLATCMDGLASDYFQNEEQDNDNKKRGEAVGIAIDDNKPFLQAYGSVLNSKSTEESLANLARWEPRHGEFRFRHPWEQYLKVATLARRAACCMEALSAHTVSNGKGMDAAAEIKMPSLGDGNWFQCDCRAMCQEAGAALRELSSSMKDMAAPGPSMRAHVAAAMAAADKLKSKAVNIPGCVDLRELHKILQTLAISSLVVQIVRSVAEMADAVEELTRLARFRVQRPSSSKAAAVEPLSEANAQVADATDDKEPPVTIVVEK